MWIVHGSGDAATGPGGPGDPGAGGTRRAHGGPGRSRWIALAVGFVALVAVIGAQHFLGGQPAASTLATSSASSAPAPTTSPPAPPSTGRSGAPDTAQGTPLSEVAASLSQAGSVLVTAATSPVVGPEGPSGPTSEPASPTLPSTTTLDAPAPPDSDGWELVGYGPTGIVRYQPATGRKVTTPVPPIESNNMLSIVPTPAGVIVRSMDNVPGYLVPDGKPAEPLTGMLEGGTRVLPGPEPGQVWVVGDNVVIDDGTGDGDSNVPDATQGRPALVLVDAHGRPTRTRIDLPSMIGLAGGYSISPDGGGYALVDAVGGVYDALPDGLHLVTHGVVLAAGPTGFLVYDCDDTAHCSASTVERRTGARRAVPGFTANPAIFPAHGPISPDGAYAAMPSFGPGGPRVDLVDLTTGHVTTLDAYVGGAFTGDAADSLAFTPDSRLLLVAGMVDVTPVDTATGTALDPLPVPVSFISVRPAG